MDEIIALARQLLERLESYKQLSKEQLPKEQKSETRDEMEILAELFKQPSRYNGD